MLRFGKNFHTFFSGLLGIPSDTQFYNSHRDSIQYKVEMAKDYGLGGIMWWATDIDDFDGSFCNEGKYPLMTRARNTWLDGNYIPTTARPTTQPTTTQSTASTQSSTSGGGEGRV